MVATLNLIRQAHDKDLLALDPGVFEGPVMADVPMRLPIVGLKQAEVGTSPQAMFDLLDQVQASVRPNDSQNPARPDEPDDR